MLRRAIGRHRGRMIAGMLVLALHQATEVAVPITIGIFVDQAVSTGRLEPLLWCVLMMFALFAVLSNAWKTGARQVVHAIEYETHLLRLEIARRVLDPRGHQTGLRSGELLQIATSDAEKASLVLRAVSLGFAGSAALVVSSVALLLVDVPLGLGVMIGVPLLVLGIQALSPLLTRRTASQQEAVASTTALATDLVGGLRTLRGIGAQHNAAERYRRSSQDTLKATLRAASTNGLQDGVTNALSGLLLAAVAGVAGWFALDGRISIGELITVVGLAQFIAEPVGLLGYSGQVFATSRASAGRLASVLGSPWAITTGTSTSLDPAKPLLSLEGVGYKTLSSLDLSLRPGELVGVLCYDPRDADALLTVVAGRTADHTGRVLVGGTAVEELDIDLVRRSVLVEQHDTDLFEGTLRSNLLAGASNIAGVERAIGAAAATDVIDAYADGLDHPLSDRGRTLSGGQRQRLGLARALLAEPPVLVLHDPSTAVDAVTEEALGRRTRGGPWCPDTRDPGTDEQPCAAGQDASGAGPLGRRRSGRGPACRAGRHRHGVPGSGTAMSTSELLPIAGPRATWVVLWREIRRLRVLSLVAAAVVTVGSAAGLVAPWALGVLVDDVAAGADGSAVVRVVVLIGGAALLSGVLTALGVTLIARVGETVLARIREQVLDRVLHLPAPVLDKIRTGDLLSRVGDDVASVAAALTQLGPVLLAASLTIVLTAGGMFALDWRLGLAGLLSLPMYLLALRWYLPRSAPFYSKERLAMGERSEAIITSLRGSATVRAYRLEETQLERIADRSATARDLSLNVFRLFSFFSSRVNHAEFVGLTSILVAGFFLVRADLVTIGATTAAALYFHRLFNPIGALLMQFDQVQTAAAGLARLAGVLTLEPAVEPPPGPSPADASVELVGIGHSYDGPLVVDGVSLRIEPGERVALVGASGAGKTTLAAIAAGVLMPTAGTVRLGGVDIRALGEVRTQQQVALLSQEVHVFSGALLDDVRLAKASATVAEVEEALEARRRARLGACVAGRAAEPGGGERAPVDRRPGTAGRAGAIGARGPAGRSTG